jgi:hypothetical protein
MHCFSCDCNLTDFESTRKSKVTGQYLDLCNECFSEVSDVFVSEEERLEQEELRDESPL